jgi:four helix bundle protein
MRSEERGNRIRSYRELRVWQLAMDVAECVYSLTASFPKSETYGLSSQLQRAAVSIPANIAEGHGRGTTRDYLRHLAIARGSLAEVETFILLALRLRYLQQTDADGLLQRLDEISRMLRGLQKSLRSKLT